MTDQIKETYPLRGVLWGIMFGLGLMVVAIVSKVIALSLVSALAVLILGIAIGTTWSILGPAQTLKSGIADGQPA